MLDFLSKLFLETTLNSTVNSVVAFKLSLSRTIILPPVPFLSTSIIYLQQISPPLSYNLSDATLLLSF